LEKLFITTRGQITILPTAEHQYLEQNGSNIHLQKWVLEVEQSN
jgi:hypothetical protein